MVLGGGERECGLAVDEGEEARFLATQEFLDDDLGAGYAEGSREARLDRGLSLGHRLADHHALAGREAVGLHHDRQLLPLEVGLGCPHVVEAAVGGGRNAELAAQILGEPLRPFEPRCRLARPEALDAGGRQIIDEP